MGSTEYYLKDKVGFSFCFDVSALRNAGQTFFCEKALPLRAPETFK